MLLQSSKKSPILFACQYQAEFLQGTNIMANQVTAPINNYFEKVLYENWTFEIPPLWFLKVIEG
jgi:hypothetical protein